MIQKETNWMSKIAGFQSLRPWHFDVKYGIRGTFYCHKISKKYTAYEALESMKRWIQGKKLGPSTIETVLFTKYSLFTDSKKPKMV